MASERMKRIPDAENDLPGVLCVSKSGMEYPITQSYQRGKQRFTLWRQTGESVEKLETADTPTLLYEEIPWKD